MLKTFSHTLWDNQFAESLQKQAISDLETGYVLYFPQLDFKLSTDEMVFLTPKYSDERNKNISYDPKKSKIHGIKNLSLEQQHQLQSLLLRYGQYAALLINALLPRYSPHLQLGRTSFRPVEIYGRTTSYRKDDKRLHVDAFPSSPNQGKRILRVFSNINPHGAERVWRLGEPFATVAEKFLPHVKKPLPVYSQMLKLLKITKSYRTAYDHYMLHIHDNMKADEDYQRQAKQQEVKFPANTTWIVQTDHVSHAAMQGQYVLEQTFYLPVQAMENAALSPLRVLEGMVGMKLV
jgi:3-deoxy-D-manno-oct-2-ulosonic acid (Kdo) hydroxylase